MKKFSLMLLSAAFLLSACSEGEFKGEIKQIFDESLVSKEILKHEISAENRQMETFLLDSLGIENTPLTVEDSALYPEFKEKLNDLKRKSELTLKSLEFNDNRTKANAVIDVSYYSLGETLASSIENSLDISLAKTYSGEKLSELEFYDNTLEIILENDFSSLEKKTSSDLKVELTKENGEWRIISLNESLLDALTLEFFSKKEEVLNVKLSKVKENIEFSQIEKNLREIHSKTLKEMNGKGKDFYSLDYEELRSKLESLDIEISFYDEEKRDYHVGFDMKKNEIFVQYNKEGEFMKLSLPVE